MTVTPEQLAQLPHPYACTVCGATNVKLWRQYAVMLVTDVRLKCQACAENGQQRLLDLEVSDQIGGLVPAVPTADGSYWGYTSVPDDGVQWWKDLPTRQAVEEGGST